MIVIFYSFFLFLPDNQKFFCAFSYILNRNKHQESSRVYETVLFIKNILPWKSSSLTQPIMKRNCSRQKKNLQYSPPSQFRRNDVSCGQEGLIIFTEKKSFILQLEIRLQMPTSHIELVYLTLKG